MSLAASTGTSPESAALSSAALLGGIAGPDAHILGPADNPVGPNFNLLVTGGEDASWQRLQQLILGPVESLQARLRVMSRAVHPERVAEIENRRGAKNITQELHAAVGREFPDNGLPLGPLDGLRANVALRQPSVLLSSPSPEIFKQGVEEVLDRHVLITYTAGLLFEELARLAPSRQWLDLLKTIVAALDGHDDRFERTHTNEGYGRLAALRATLLMTCKESQAVQAMGSSNSEVQRLLSQCLVLRPRFGTPAVSESREYLRGGFGAYTAAATDVLSSRRSGDGVQFKVTDADYELLVGYTAYLQSVLPKVQSLPQQAWALDLPWKISWAMMVLKGKMEPGDWCVPYAIHVAHTALLEHSAFSRQEHKKLQDREEERARLVMLNKLAKLGPCQLRQLLRTFKVQRKALYEPVLDGLISEGLIVREGSRYALAVPAEAKEVG